MSVEKVPPTAVEIEHKDSAPRGERGETSFAQLVADGNVTIQRVAIPPGTDEPAHYHDEDTYVYHLSGLAEVRFGEGEDARTEVLKPGEMLKIPAGVVHQPSAFPGATLETVAVRTGADVETIYVDD